MIQTPDKGKKEKCMKKAKQHNYPAVDLNYNI